MPRTQFDPHPSISSSRHFPAGVSIGKIARAVDFLRDDENERESYAARRPEGTLNPEDPLTPTSSFHAILKRTSSSLICDRNASRIHESTLTQPMVITIQKTLIIASLYNNVAQSSFLRYFDWKFCIYLVIELFKARLELLCEYKEDHFVSNLRSNCAKDSRVKPDSIEGYQKRDDSFYCIIVHYNNGPSFLRYFVWKFCYLVKELFKTQLTRKLYPVAILWTSFLSFANLSSCE